MVFEPSAAPTECPAFMDWYQAQTSWSEPHRYEDPEVTTPTLRQWYESMRVSFPAMNGPDATDDYDTDRVAGYTIGTVVIYTDFRWSVAEEAYEASLRQARQNRLGFFDASGSGDVWLPVEGGDYRVLHCGGKSQSH